MHFKETAKICGYFDKAINFVLIMGFIAGIVFGISLREPTVEAINAISELASSEYIGAAERETLIETSKKASWTLTSTGAMLSTWIMSMLASLVLYAKKYHLAMLDKMVDKLAKIEDRKITAEAVEKTTEHATAAE